MEIVLDLTLAGIIALLTLVMGIMVKAVGHPDQIFKNFKSKSTKGLSSVYIILLFISYALWTIHGIMKGDEILIFGQGFGILTTSVIIGQIIYYKNKRDE